MSKKETKKQNVKQIYMVKYLRKSIMKYYNMKD